MFDRNSVRFFCIYLSICFVMGIDIIFRPKIIRLPFEVFLKVEQHLEKGFFLLLVSMPAYFSTQKDLQLQIADLQTKNAQLQVEVAESLFLRQENQELRLQIEKDASQDAQKREQKVAHIISLDEKSYLDIGANQDIHPKDIVLYQNVLIGQIDEVNQYFSSWKSLNYGSLEVVGENGSGTKGVVKRGTKSLELSHISVDKKIEVDEYIYTSGSIEQGVPKGLFIGQVSEVITDPGSPFKTAILKQPIDWSMVSVVMVVQRF